MNSARATVLLFLLGAAALVAIFSRGDMTAMEAMNTTTTLAAAHDQNEDSLSLTIVSMNLAECQPSAEAPSSWDTATASQAIRRELLQHNPDVLALQECPYDSFAAQKQWAATFFGGDEDENSSYVLLGIAPAHAGSVMLFLRKSLVKKYRATRVSLERFPAVVAKLELPGQQKRTVLLVSCHLEPFQEGKRKRHRQISRLIDVQKDENQPAPTSSSSWMIIAGDTNMRTEEDAVMEGPELQFSDVWKLAGMPQQAQYTWDTRDNRRDGNHGGSFNRYYGHQTRQYRTRYDRIYLHHSDGRRSDRAKVPSFQVIANQPIPPSQTHFLSDHFGILANVQLDW